MFAPTTAALVLASTCVALGPQGPALTAAAPPTDAPFEVTASNLVLPHLGVSSLDASGTVQELADLDLVGVEAHVAFDATGIHTRLDVHLTNHTTELQPAQVLLPLPADATAARAGGLDGGVARALAAEDATDILLAAGLLAGTPLTLGTAGLPHLAYGPVELAPGATAMLRFEYDQPLDLTGGRAEYVLERGAGPEGTGVPFRLTAESTLPLVGLGSPSHRVQAGPTAGTLLLSDPVAPGPVVLDLLAHLPTGDGAGELGASLHLSEPEPAALPAAPDLAGSAAFLLRTGVAAAAPSGETQAGMPREVTLVIDTSGSMRIAKLDDARRAARDVLAALDEGEAFNLISYASSAKALFPHPIAKGDETLARAEEFLDALEAKGKTDIEEALLQALAPPPPAGTLPLVLLLTDGKPTEGETDEARLRRTVAAANRHGRRIFTFGVGNEVNAPLLDGLARSTRATSTFVRGHAADDVRAAIRSVFQAMRAPAFVELELVALGHDGQVLGDGALGMVSPRVLPDLYRGGELLVTGRVTGEVAGLRLRGNLLGQPHELDLPVPGPASTRTGRDFAGPIWAAREAAELVEGLRQAAADQGRDRRGEAQVLDRLLLLAKRYGAIDAHTAFLTLDQADRQDAAQQRATLLAALTDRAMAARIGAAAVEEARASQRRLGLGHLTRDDRARVRQVAGRTFLLRGSTWIDARLLAAGTGLAMDRFVTPGSPAYRELLAELAAAGRAAQLALPGSMVVEHQGQAIFVER